MPGVDLEEQGDVSLVLHDLKRIRRVDGAGEPEREAAARVIAVSRVIRRPVLKAPRRERQLGAIAFCVQGFPVLRRIGWRERRLGVSALIAAVAGHVGHVRRHPHAAQVGPSVRAAGRGTRG